MKFIVLTLLSICVITQDITLQFYEYVLNDTRNSSFLVIDIKQKSITKKAIIENTYLTQYFTLALSDTFNRKSYMSMMKNNLIHHIPIEINDSILKNHPEIVFSDITPTETVTANSLKGVDAFLDIYFNKNRTLKSSSYGSQVPAIIQKLFEWGITTYRDHETQLLCYHTFKPLKYQPRTGLE